MILATSEGSEERGTERSITWVAPRDFRYASFDEEAVVMIGENPEIFANWMTEGDAQSAEIESEVNATYHAVQQRTHHQ